MMSSTEFPLIDCSGSLLAHLSAGLLILGLYLITRMMDRIHTTMFPRHLSGKQEEWLDIVFQIAQSILIDHTATEPFSEVLERIRALLRCRRISIAEFDPNAFPDGMTIRHVCGADACPGQRVEAEVFGSFEELQRGRPHIVVDVQKLPRISPLIEDLKKRGIRSYVNIPLIFRGELIGTFNLASDRAGGRPKRWLRTACRLASFLAVALAHSRLLGSISQQRDWLRTLSTRLTTVEEKERRRLARELHDQVGDNLTSLSLNLERCRLQVEKSAYPELQALVEDSQQQVDELGAVVRGVMDELRPSVLDNFGLFAALRWYAKRFTDRSGIRSRVWGREPSPPIPAEPAIQLFRFVQEALTNVVRHARASWVLINLRSKSHSVRLVVADNGIGFDSSKVFQPSSTSSLGLISMRERIELIGGRLEVHSRPGAGTRLVAILDLSRNR